MNRFAPVLICSLLSAVLAVFIYKQFEQPHTILVREAVPVNYVHSANDDNNDAFLLSESSTSPKTGTPDFIFAANKSKRSVVSVQSLNRSTSYWRSDNNGTSTGSGVIISPDGYIATNNHVIESGSDISIRLDDQREFKAVVIGRDQHTDLALIKIEGKNLPFIKFGNSDSLQVGEWVLAIGNPFRLHSTVTAGIVSAKGRSIHIMRDASGIESFIQTDAAVNPGNSGGALVNAKGDLVGINTAIITYSGQYEGFSFAVPANLARKVLNDLRDFGKVQRGWMGISIRQVDAQMAKNLKLGRVGGVYIDEVIENSAAEASGLKPGDVIMEINGLETKTTPQFMEQVARMRPGDKLEIEYSRNGNLRITTVVLSDDRVVRTSFVAGDEILSQLGVELRDLSPSEISRLGKPGVFVKKIYRGTKIDRVNMEEGYIITRVNGKPVNDLDAFLNVLQTTEGLVVLDGFYEDYPGKFPYTFELD